MQSLLGRFLVYYRGLLGKTGCLGKIVLLALPLLFVCMCCGIGQVVIFSRAPSSNPSTSQARLELATAHAIETENAGIIAGWTATSVASLTTATTTATDEVLSQLGVDAAPVSTSTDSPIPFSTAAPTVTRVFSAPTPDQVTGLVTQNVIVRSGPGAGYKQLGGLKKGERVLLMGISTDKAWYQHSKGWSSGNFLQVSGNVSKLPIVLVALEPTFVPPTIAPTNTPVIVIAPPTSVPSSGGVRVGAICKDGTTSGATGSGACSHHGGVSYWLYR